MGCFVLKQEGAAFLDLAQSGEVDSHVIGDRDLLLLSGQTKFLIESPDAYRHRCLET